jgi:DNA-binding PucR family transcriptional regulator
VDLPNAVTRQIAEIAELQLRDADALAAAIGTAILESAPILLEDPALTAEMHASNRANVRRFLSQQIAHPGQQPPSDIPPEALDLARTMVRRGVDLGVLANAYRRGQNVAWEQWMEKVLRIAAPEELPAVLAASATLLFSFVDSILTGLIAQIERERAALLGGNLAKREQTLRLLLDGAPLEPGAAGATLGYELNRLHTAFIVWGEPTTVSAADLEAAATALAQAAGASRPLRFSASAASLWGWLGSDSTHGVDVERLRAAAETFPPAVRTVTGATRRGAVGFRQTHDDAIATQRLLSAGPAAERFAAYRDVEVITLFAADEQRLREFVSETLGPLAGPGVGLARLRDTLRVYIQEADNSATAAARLNTHRNTVLHRVTRAQELLGAPLASRRLAVSTALEAAHRIGLPG